VGEGARHAQHAEKNDAVLKCGFAELEHCRKAGVKMAYGPIWRAEDEQTAN
jgi:hypothetical protein